MKFKMIADDRKVSVNGDPRILGGDVVLPEGVYAITWNETWGTIEYYRPDEFSPKPENKKFFDLSPYQYLVEAHADAVARDEAQRVAEEERRAKAEAEKLAKAAAKTDGAQT